MRRAIRHDRIDLHRSALTPDLFAHYYRAAPFHEPHAPLVCYWGGAITAREYEDDRRHAPAAVLSEWLAASRAQPRPPDLLLLSVPDLPSSSSAALRHQLLRAFCAQLLPASPNPRPSATAFVGYSAGALLATCLALDLPSSRALATIGGVGMTVPLLDSPGVPLSRLAVRSFSNADDPCCDQTLEFVAAMNQRGVRVQQHRGAGGHDLADYVSNRSLRAAFAESIQRIVDVVAPPAMCSALREG
jgi:hypothetical protein